MWLPWQAPLPPILIINGKLKQIDFITKHEGNTLNFNNRNTRVHPAVLIVLYYYSINFQTKKNNYLLQRKYKYISSVGRAAGPSEIKEKNLISKCMAQVQLQLVVPPLYVYTKVYLIPHKW